MSLLVVMGSGETAPAMVKTHREIFARSGSGPAAMLDTPFGFQMNADELVARTRTYFRESVGNEVVVARWRHRDQPIVEREQALSLLAQARWVFAGPGSPTYALRQWHDTAVPDALGDVVARGGTLLLGSAAAVTLGAFAVPVYEIYKVGEEARWVGGLDLLGRLTGIRAAVIPHYDNAEGGTHDTRFCYLGEQRLAQIEADLPDDAGILGVDEHTALVIDLAARTVAVAGSGETFDDMAVSPPPRDAASSPGNEQPSLTRDTDVARVAFEAAIQARDGAGCVRAVLNLEQAIHDWSSDTLQGEAMSAARRTLRSLLVRLGGLAEVGSRDPREVVGPYVELLLCVRESARRAKDFATADTVRDRLTAAGIEVRDASSGPQWLIKAVADPS